MEKSKSAFEEGVDAFACGKNREDCPYPTEDDRRRLWLEGWDKAKRADDLHVDGLP
jgi:ribosome modulation factor